MKIKVRAKRDDGTILFDGELTGQEVAFLLGYAVNDLMTAGVQFLGGEEEEDEEGDDAEQLPLFVMPEPDQQQ